MNIKRHKLRLRKKVIKFIPVIILLLILSIVTIINGSKALASEVTTKPVEASAPKKNDSNGKKLSDFINLDSFNESIEKSCIDIISCNGLTYKNYIEVAKLINKKVAVITDNDGDQSKINEINTDNAANQNINIFTAQSIDLFTWEKCLLEKNKTGDKNYEVLKGSEISHPAGSLLSIVSGMRRRICTAAAFSILAGCL